MVCEIKHPLAQVCHLCNSSQPACSCAICILVILPSNGKPPGVLSHFRPTSCPWCCELTGLTRERTVQVDAGDMRKLQEVTSAIHTSAALRTESVYLFVSDATETAESFTDLHITLSFLFGLDGSFCKQLIDPGSKI